jgi:hypothetical protein
LQLHTTKQCQVKLMEVTSMLNTWPTAPWVMHTVQMPLYQMLYNICFTQSKKNCSIFRSQKLVTHQWVVP